MKRIKSLCALLLAGVMALSAVYTAQAEEVYDPEIFGEETEPAVAATAEPEVKEVQKALDSMPAPILSGVDAVAEDKKNELEIMYRNLVQLKIFPDAQFDEEKKLSRAEFAEIIARIVSDKETQNGGILRFEYKDIDEQTAGREAINYLTGAGIVDGYGDGTFLPNENIKSSEAIVMLVNMMGYYEIAHILGDGWEGYLKTARQLKLDKDINCSEADELSMGAAVKAVYRVLHERMAAPVGYASDNISVSSGDETVMYHYMGIQTIEGVVTANEYTSLYSQSGRLGEKQLEIEGVVLDFRDSDIDPSDYLGLYTRVYYREDSPKNMAVLAEYLPKKHKILKISSKDIIRYNEENSSVAYEDKNRTREQKIPVNINIIFNGVANEGIIDQRKFVPDIGQLVFADNDNDGKYDVLFINSYATYLVKNTLSGEDDTIYDDLGVQPALSLKNKTVKVLKNNSYADIADIQAGDVALVAANEIKYVQIGTMSYIEPDVNASEAIRIAATDYEISGMVEEYGSEDTVVFDGIEYELDKGFLVAAEKGTSSKAQKSRSVNVTARAGVNAMGNIVWLIRSGSGELKYGYVVNIKNDEETDVNTIKLFTQDDEMILTKFSDKVKVYAMWSGGSIHSGTYYGKRIEGNEIINIDQLYRDGKARQQLVQYKLDSKGNVSVLYLAAKDTRSYLNSVPVLQDDVLYLSYSIDDSAKEYYYNFGAATRGGVISPLFEYNAVSTYGFEVPKSDSIYDEKYFSVHHAKEVTLFSNGSEVKNMDMYNVRNGVIGAFVYKQDVSQGGGEMSKEFTPDSTFLNIIVDDRKTLWDDYEGEMRTTITGYSRNQLQTFEFTGADMLSVKNDNVPEYSLVPSSKLRKGDIILAHQDGIGRIDGFKIAHRVQYEIEKADDGTPAGRERNWNGTEFTNRSMYVRSFMRGKVVRSIDKVPFVDTNNVNNILRRILLYGSVNQCVIYDMSENTLTLTQNNIKIANFDEIKEGDYLFWYQSERATLSAVAVRNY